MNARQRKDIFTKLCKLPAVDNDSLEGLLGDVDDWQSLSRHMLAHGIQGICYPLLKDASTTLPVPEDVLEKLHLSVRATSAKNLLHKSVLLKILDTVGDEIPILLTKGISLMQYSYKRPSMRPMADVDFYIRREDVEPFEERMEKAGFTAEERRKRPRQWWIDNFQHLEPYLSPDGRVRVEPHLRNAGAAMPYRMEIEKAWERAERQLVDGRTVFVMAPDDDLAALILHLYVHDIHLIKLLGLVDLDRTIRTAGDLDWNRLVKTGREQGYDKLLYLPLALTKNLLGTPIPNELLDACRPDDLTGSDLQFLLGYMFRENIAREQVPFGLTKAAASGGFFETLKLSAKRAFPTDQELTERYNLSAGSASVWWYRLVHPLYLLKRWGRFVAGLLTGGQQKKLLGLTEKVSGWVTHSDYQEKQ